MLDFQKLSFFLSKLQASYKQATSIQNMFMDNEIYYEGSRIFALGKIQNVILNIAGKNNKIYLEKTLSVGYLKISMQSNIENCIVILGKNTIINNTITINFYCGGGRCPNGSGVIIGENNCFNGNVSIVAPFGKDIFTKIGDYNLFAGNIRLHSPVDHLIYDIKSQQKFDEELGITIGDKVWVCEDVLCLNKAVVPSNSVVATRSLVNKNFEQEHILLAGQPAKIVKHNVMWNLNVNDDFMSCTNPLNL